MKLSKDEIIKKLAETIVECQTVYDYEGKLKCSYCGELQSHHAGRYPHKENCPVLLAEEVLKNPVNVCSHGQGKGKIEYEYRHDDIRSYPCSLCNGTGLDVDVIE